MSITSRDIKDFIWNAIRFFSDRVFYEKLRAYYNLGYWPNLKDPSTFNEKVIYSKLYNSPKNAKILADKYAVRHFVEKATGSHILNKLYFVGNNPDDIPFETLPDKFVVKTTHGSGGIYIVKDKNQENLTELKVKVRKSLKQNFGFITNEPWYLNIQPRVIVEELMQDKIHGIPYDYKFFCFHEKCHYIQVDQDRFEKHSRSFYTPDWTYQNFGLLFPKGTKTEEPSNLTEMVKTAEKLSQGYDFVRVDLYSVNGETRFGEMTFAPGAGWEPFDPKNKDMELGNLW